MIVTMERASVPGHVQAASMVRFTAAARLLGHAARQLGLFGPGLRSPPRLVGADRTLRRRRDGCTVAVRVRGRMWVAVLADMVEGVVVANRLRGPTADRAREALWAAVAAELEGGGARAEVA
jgi:hypothetical protein